MSNETSESHTSALDKVKNFFHHSEHSAHGKGFPDSEIRDEVDKAVEIHGNEENRADVLIHDRELSEHEQVMPSTNKALSTASTLNPAAAQDSNLSSYLPRQSLDAAAHDHSGAVGSEHPDFNSYHHIPEDQLMTKLHARSEHTALRPADPNDPNSMDGKPEPSSAGDDLAI